MNSNLNSASVGNLRRVNKNMCSIIDLVIKFRADQSRSSMTLCRGLIKRSLWLSQTMLRSQDAPHGDTTPRGIALDLRTFRLD